MEKTRMIQDPPKVDNQREKALENLRNVVGQAGPGNIPPPAVSRSATIGAGRPTSAVERSSQRENEILRQLGVDPPQEQSTQVADEPGTERTYSDNPLVRYPQRISDAVVNLSQGFVAIVPDIMKAPDMLLRQLEEAEMWVLKNIHGETEYQILQRKGLYRDDLVPLEERPLYATALQFETFINNALDNAKFDQTPENKEAFWQTQLPQGLGSMASFIVLSYLTRGQSMKQPSTSMGRVKKVMDYVTNIGKEMAKSPATYVAASGASTRAYDESRQAGQDESTSLTAARYAAPSGAFQVANVVRLNGKLDKALQGKLSGKLIDMIKEGVVSGLNEKLVEAIGAVGYNAAMKKVWDTDRELIENVWEQAQVGGATGFFSGFAIALLGAKRGPGGRIQRPANDDFATQAKRNLEGKPAAPDNPPPMSPPAPVVIQRDQAEPGDRVGFETGDGDIFEGEVITTDGKRMRVSTEQGNMTIPVEQVVRVTRQSETEQTDAETKEQPAEPETQEQTPTKEGQEQGQDAPEKRVLTVKQNRKEVEIPFIQTDELGNTFEGEQTDLTESEANALIKKLEKDHSKLIFSKEDTTPDDPFAKNQYRIKARLKLPKRPKRTPEQIEQDRQREAEQEAEDKRIRQAQQEDALRKERQLAEQQEAQRKATLEREKRKQELREQVAETRPEADFIGETDAAAVRFNPDRVSVTRRKNKKTNKFEKIEHDDPGLEVYNPETGKVLRPNHDDYAPAVARYIAQDKELSLAERYENEENFNTRESNPVDFYQGILEESRNPFEVAQAFIELSDPALELAPDGGAEYMIAENMIPMKTESFELFADKQMLANDLRALRMNYGTSEATGSEIQEVAQIASNQAGYEITPDDVWDFMLKYPGGAQTFFNQGKSKLIQGMKDHFEALTGLKLTERVAEELSGRDNMDEYIQRTDEWNKSRDGLASRIDELTNSEINTNLNEFESKIAEIDDFLNQQEQSDEASTRTRETTDTEAGDTRAEETVRGDQQESRTGEQESQEAVPAQEVEPESQQARNFAEDIPAETAERAWSGVSFDPQKRGQSFINEYADFLESAWNELSAIAETDQQKALLETEFQVARERYKKKALDFLSAQSRVMSTMITGPANFPTRSNQKKGDTRDKRMSELIEMTDNFVERIKKKLEKARTPEQLAEAQSAEADTIAEQAQKDADFIVDGIIGEKDGTPFTYSPQLLKSSLAAKIKNVAFKGKPDLAKKIIEQANNKLKEAGLKPLFTDRHRVHKFIQQAEEQIASPAQKQSGNQVLYETEGLQIVRDFDADRIQIKTPEKPSAEFRSKLKSASWRWSPTNKAWQRKDTRAGLESALDILGINQADLTSEQTGEPQPDKKPLPPIEYRALESKVQDLESRLSGARERLKEKKAELSKTLDADNRDLFGDKRRTAQQTLIDTDADPKQVQVALAPLQAEVERLQEQYKQAKDQLEASEPDRGGLFAEESVPYQYEKGKIQYPDDQIQTIQDTEGEPINFVSGSQIGLFDNWSEQPSVRSRQQEGQRTRASEYLTADTSQPEFIAVRRQWEETGYFDFARPNVKLRSAQDAAYLFRQLEKEADEHFFAVYIQSDGTPIVHHLSTGSPSGTMAHVPTILAGVKSHNAQKLLIVHNHPSGTLRASRPDIKIYRKIKESLPEGVELMPGIVINLYEGKYLEFTDRGDQGTATAGPVTDGEIKTKVYTFSRRAFAEDTHKLPKMEDPESAARFVSASKYSVGDKMQAIIIDGGKNIHGRITLDSDPFSSATADKIKAIVGETGGNGVILVGRNSKAPSDIAIQANSLKEKLNVSSVTLIDVIFVDAPNGILRNYKSLLTERILHDPGSQYGGMVRDAADQTQTPEFKEWFGNSKVVDSGGNPMVVYHGTPGATFTIFREDSHFTDSPQYASVYTETAASSSGRAKQQTAPAVYPVYLKIEKPFDTRIPKIREVFEKEYFGKWGNRTPLQNGLPDWTESNNLIEWIQETGQDFDGLILDEGGTPEGGYRGLSYVPLSSTQIKSATGNQGTFDPNNPDIRFQLSPQQKAEVEVVRGFYSPIEARLQQTKRDKESAKWWSDFVGKKDEAQWTGVRQWLEGLDPAQQISKQEILDWMGENRVQVEIKKLGEQTPQWEQNKSGNWFKRTAEGRTKIINHFRGGYAVESPSGLVEGRFDTVDEAKAFFDGRTDRNTETKYSMHVLPGQATDYKEVLVTLPQDRIRLDELTKKIKEEGATPELLSEHNRLRTEINSGRFYSPHFPNTPSIIAHLRMNTRTDANGNKVLFLEEVQSDWGQAIRRGKAPQTNRVWSVVQPDGAIETNFRSEQDAQRWADNEKKHYYDNRPETAPEPIYRITSNQTQVSGPFVTKTNDWVKLGLKVAMQEAVAQNADYIAWTTGAQQTDRYDLSKQVDEILYDNNSDGTYDIIAVKDGNNIVQRQFIAEKELESLVGKEIAEKIVSDKEVNRKNTHKKSISGVNLRVGGEGMTAFYGDTNNPGIIGNAAKSLTKGVVESVRIESTTQPAIRITPDVIAQVEAGLPLFQKTGTKPFSPFTPENASQPTAYTLDEQSVRERIQALYTPTETASEIAGSIRDKVKGWDAPIVVAETMADVPAELRYIIASKRNLPGGVYYNGTSYILAFAQRNTTEAWKTVLHEAIGHGGIRRLIESKTEGKAEARKEYNGLLDEVYQSYKDDQRFNDIARRYNADLTTKAGQRLAADEMIAKLAESSENKTLLDKIVAFIRKLARELGFDFRLNDSDILSILSDARAALEQSQTTIRPQTPQHAGLTDRGLALYNFTGSSARLTAEVQANLETATEMETQGYNSGPWGDTRLATGWFRNIYDGKWRYEIDTSQYAVKNPGAATLGELLDAPRLFEKYPQLADVKVTTYNAASDNPGGKYNSGDMSISASGRNAAEAVGVLVHEIQHGIQDIEGFASGGSPRMVRDMSNNLMRRIDDYNYQMSALVRRRDNNEITQEQFRELYDQTIAERNRLSQEYNALQGKYGHSYDGYNRLAGEIEAREAQRRTGLSAIERFENAPSFENISRDEAIVIFDSNGEQGYGPQPNPLILPWREVQALRNEHSGKQSYLNALAEKIAEVVPGATINKSKTTHSVYINAPSFQQEIRLSDHTKFGINKPTHVVPHNVTLRNMEAVLNRAILAAETGATNYKQVNDIRFQERDATEMSLTDYGDQRRVPGGLGRIARLKGFFIEPLHWLEQKPQLKPLADATRNYYDRWAQRRGMLYGRVHRDILKPLSKLKRRERKAVLDQFEEFMRNRETGQQPAADQVRAEFHPLAEKMVEYTEFIANYAGKLNQLLDVQVFDPSIGKWRQIGRIKDFFPRKLNALTEATLRNPNKYPEHWNDMVEALIEEGHVETRAEADRYLNTYVQDYTSNDYFAGIEKARTKALPSIAYDYRFEVMLDYTNRWSERVTQIEFFGQVTDPQTTKDLFDTYGQNVADENTRNFIDALQKRVYNHSTKDGFHKTIAFLNKSASGLQLGNWGTATLNLIGGTTLNFMAYPISANLKAMGHLLKPSFNFDFRNKSVGRALKDIVELRNLADMIEEGRLRGAITNDMISLLRDTEAVDGFIKTPEVLQKLGLPPTVDTNRAMNDFVNFTMKWGGYIPTEMFIRSHAQLTGKYVLQDMLKQIGRNPTSRKSLKHIRWMEENGFDYRRLMQENGTGPYTERYIRYASNLTQGSYKVDQTPIHLDTPVGRFFFKYVKFISQVSRMWYKNHYKPFMATITQGGTDVKVEVDGVMTTKRVAEFSNMIKFFAMSAIGGEAVRSLRALLFGYQFTGPELEEIEKALEDDDRMRALGLAFDRAFWNIQATGGLTIFGNYWQLTQDTFSRERSRNPLDPPGFGVLKNTYDFTMDIYDQQAVTARDIDNFIERQFSLYRTTKRPILRGARRIDVDPLGEASQYQARLERNYVRALKRRWEEDQGIEGGRTRMGRIGRTQNSIMNQRVHEALSVGEPGRAFAIFLREAEKRPGQIESMRASVRSSMRHRKPLGNVSEADEAVFFEWLDNAIPTESVQRVRDIEGQYTGGLQTLMDLIAPVAERIRAIDADIERLQQVNQTKAVKAEIDRLDQQRKTILREMTP